MSRALKDYNSVDWGGIFYYDETSPSFLRYAVDTVRKRKGDVAGCKANGYYTVSFNNSNWFAHRVIWIIKNGYLSNDLVIDHLDNDGTNNNISNLRVTTQKYNNRNSSARNSNTSGKTGIRFTTFKSKSIKGLYTYCSAFWYEEVNGKTKKITKHFSVHKLGLLPAYSEAVKLRELKIEELNSSGYGYTNNHGIVNSHEPKP